MCAPPTASWGLNVPGVGGHGDKVFLFLSPQDNGQDGAPPGVWVSWAGQGFPGMISFSGISGLKRYHRRQEQAGSPWSHPGPALSWYLGLCDPQTDPVSLTILNTWPIQSNFLTKHLFSAGPAGGSWRGAAESGPALGNGHLFLLGQELKPAPCLFQGQG